MKIEVGDWVRCPGFKKQFGTKEFTPGKLYKVFDVLNSRSTEFGHYFRVMDDEGRWMVCNTRHDSYIGDRDWEVLSFEENLKSVLE